MSNQIFIITLLNKNIFINVFLHLKMCDFCHRLPLRKKLDSTICKIIDKKTFLDG